MNCIIKSWKCPVCHREEYINQPTKKHFSGGAVCKGEWECYEWRRQLKQIQNK